LASKNLKRNGFLLACLLPGLVLYCTLVLVPFARTIELSGFRFSGVSTNRKFVGLDNFGKLWESEPFWWAIRNSVTMLLIVGPIILVISMLLAHAAQGTSRLARLMRTVYLFPNLISLVAAALIWRNIYNPSVGLLRGIGLPGPQNGWLGDLETAFPAFSVAFAWVTLGFYTMLFSAGLAGIPAEVHEASELEGAHGFSKYVLITRPLLWSVRRVASVHITIAALGVFALVNVMTDGEPSGRTQSILNYLYRMMTIEGEFGKAAALGVVMMVITSITSLILWMLFRRDPAGRRSA